MDGGNTSYKFGLVIGKFPKESCNCNSLTDFVRYMYKGSEQSQGFSFINDSQTTIGKNYSGWEYEYSFLHDGEKATGLAVLAKNNDNYYSVGISYPNESRAILLPEFKTFINSIEFLPIQVTKTPSFMNMSETEESKPNATIENSPNGLQILSDNSFTDSVGYFHVVGEVENNSPTVAKFVKVTGTFYDSNNQVVGTQFTYTNSSDIGAGEKAPFDLTLLSASIPISQIDHYNLQASYQ